MKGYTTGEDFQDLMRIAVRLIPMYDVPYNDEEEDYEEAFQNAPNDCEMKSGLSSKSKCVKNVCMNLLMIFLIGSVHI